MTSYLRMLFMMSPGIILFLALFHLAIDWIGMIKYYFHPTKVNILRIRIIVKVKKSNGTLILADFSSPFPRLLKNQNSWS